MKTYGLTMQRNRKTLGYIKCSNCPPLAVAHALSLSAINQSLDQWPYDWPSAVNQTSPQVIDISHRMCIDPS